MMADKNNVTTNVCDDERQGYYNYKLLTGKTKNKYVFVMAWIKLLGVHDRKEKCSRQVMMTGTFNATSWCILTRTIQLYDIDRQKECNSVIVAGKTFKD